MGTKKRPFYRIVAIDSRRARDGSYLENLGTYDPIGKPAVVKVFEEKLVNWFQQGATPSDTVHALLSQIGFLAKYEKIRKGEDVSTVMLKTDIRERPKKTRRVKKAALAAGAESKKDEKPAAGA
jgi:small subunit ribosomal protein S16